MRPCLPLLIPLLTLACQEPFGTDRHDLVGLRVAGISVHRLDDDAVQLGIAAVVDGKPFSAAPLELTWHDATDLDANDVAELGLDGGVASGPAPEIGGSGPGTLALVARDPASEREWRGTVSLPQVDDLDDGVVPVGTIEAYSTGRTLDAEDATVLDLEARRGWDLGEPTESVVAGDWLRLGVEVADGVRVRWMSTHPGGHFLEVDDATTDWVAASYVRDDEELEDVEIEADGVRTFMALGLDPARQGANGWAARELFVGNDVPTGIFTESGRFLQTDGSAQGTYLRGTLVADPDVAVGVRLEGVEVVDDTVDPGTDALPCTVAVSGWFDPDWLLEQRCAVEQIDGAVVVVKVRP